MFKQMPNTETRISSVSSDLPIGYEWRAIWNICKFTDVQKPNCRTIFEVIDAIW